MSLFGSTSPSYLILQSLDACNRLLSTNYPAHLQECCDRLAALRARLNTLAAGQGAALPLALDSPVREPMKLTLDAAALGLTGQALADYLRQNGMECEYADPRYLVLMFTPANPPQDFERLTSAVLHIVENLTGPFPIPEKTIVSFWSWNTNCTPAAASGRPCLPRRSRCPQSRRWGVSALCRRFPARLRSPLWSAARRSHRLPSG